MNTEDKDLLVVDLLGRAPYNVVVNVNGIKGYDRILLSLTRRKSKGGFAAVITCEDEDYLPHTYDLNAIKPYLRPMSNMSVVEENEFRSLDNEVFYKLENGGYRPLSNFNKIEWLNKHHFDYRNLIEKGLALKAPYGMYPGMPKEGEKEKDENFCEDCPYRNGYHLSCVLNWIRERMPKPNWDSDEKLKERGLAFDAPNN